MPKKTWPKITKALKHGEEKWMVDARIQGKGKRLFCDTKDEAKTLAEELRIKRGNAGTSAFSMPESDRIDAQTALHLLRPHGRTLQEAAKFYLNNIEILRHDISLDRLVAEILPAKRQDGLTHGYINNMGATVKRFARDHPSAKVTDITSRTVDAWLRSLPVNTPARNMHRTLLSVLFAFAVERSYAISNPVKKLKKAKVIPKAIEIFTVAQCVRLLEAADERTLPFLAIGLFAGLRPMSEIMRLNWEHLDFETRLIDIAADRTKTAKKRFVNLVKQHLVSSVHVPATVAFVPGSARASAPPSDAVATRRE